MAVRYVEIGQYPDVRREVRGNLSEILVATANPGTYAAPEDVTGTFLEMGTDGLWTGASVGALTQAQADALYASGALANLATGVTYREPINGTQYTYDGEEVGWRLTNLIVGPFANITEANAWAAANPSSLFLGLLATSNGQQISWGGAGWVAVGGGGSSAVASRRSFASWMPWPSRGQMATATSSNRTFQINLRAPIQKFHRIRIWVPNANQSATYDGWQGFIAAVSNVGTSFTPSVGGAVGTDPSSGFVSICGPISIPAAPASVFSVAPSPSFYVSTYIDIPSIDALDSGLPWLFIRGSFTAAGNTYSAETMNDNSVGNYHNSKYVTDATSQYIGASAAAGGTALSSGTAMGFGYISRIDFVGESDSASIDFIGASTIVGGPVDTNTDQTWVMRSILGLRALGLHPTALGTGGLSTAGIYQNVQAQLQSSSSDFVVMPIFSTNDGFGDAAVRLQLMRYFSSRAQARLIGKEVIALLLPHDGACDGGTYQAIRSSAISRIIASGAPVLDARLAIGDPAYSYNKWLPVNSNDGVHPNAAGETALAEWVPTALSAITKAYPFGR